MAAMQAIGLTCTLEYIDYNLIKILKLFSSFTILFQKYIEVLLYFFQKYFAILFPKVYKIDSKTFYYFLFKYKRNAGNKEIQ